MAEPLWTPCPERLAHARLTAFAKVASERTGRPLSAYADLHAWSVADRPAFWTAVWDACGVLGERGARTLLDGDRMPGARWFPDARLSFAENLLRRDDDAPAIVFRREDGQRRVVTFRALRAEVGRLQGALRAAGVRAGDRVAAYVPNIPEAVSAMLATASLGAVWSSCSPDFGVSGVLDRFGQIAPRVLFAADGYPWKGKALDGMGKLREIAAGLPTVERTVVIPYVHAAPPLDGLRCAVRWADFVGAGPARAPELLRFPFDQPLYILYSSGTTGKPKCIVHGAGGTLLQHLKEHQLHADVRAGDRVFYFTTTGWMMWNWLVTALASGATIVLSDGNPFHPGPAALWDLARDERTTLFGISAKYVDACKKAGLAPARTHDLAPLRTICSTGSPLVPESFDWIYAEVKRDVQLASISGGTDIVSCFVGGVPTLPVHRGEIQGAGLGMAVEVWDDAGRPVTGVPGELVCTKPFPSMPIGFWDDPDGAKYRAAYFEHFPGVWRHGDWAERTPRGGFIIYGRSDATLKPGGVRIGTAEIYREVEQVDAVEESIVIGQEWQGDQRIVLFVKLRNGQPLTPAIEEAIRARIRAHATPRHVPARIVAVTDIPRTRSNKISELAVRDVVHGRPAKNTEALANPEALAQYRARPELGE